VTRRLEKKLPNFSKNSPKSCQVKKRPKYNKAQFENPKKLHQTTFKTLKYLQPCFETAYLGKNVINMFKQKVAKKSSLFWASSSFQKITMSLQK
jgi:hypothetical protein